MRFMKEITNQTILKFGKHKFSVHKIQQTLRIWLHSFSREWDAAGGQGQVEVAVLPKKALKAPRQSSAKYRRLLDRLDSFSWQLEFVVFCFLFNTTFLYKEKMHEMKSKSKLMFLHSCIVKVKRFSGKYAEPVSFKGHVGCFFSWV